MGNIVDRGLSLVNLSRARSSDNDPSSLYSYSYPPKNGQPYFAPHFIMGGERFESFQPESFLFGENLDLNFLGSKPTPFPYTAPLPTEPTKSIRALLNIRKESVRFVRVTDPSLLPKEEQERLSNDQQQQHQDSKPGKDKVSSKDKNHQERFYYNIEFTFDSDVSCSISIYYFSTEEVSPTGVTFHPRDWNICHEKVIYPRGAGQLYSQPGHIFCPNNFNEGDLHYRAFDENGFFDSKVPFPVVIHMVALEGDEPRQSHSLVAVVEKNVNSGSFTLKPFIQKMFIDGLHFLLQEVYGIENKTVPQVSSPIDGQPVTRYVSVEEEAEESSASECVVCLSDPRDTLILPCRHLCLCNACADSLRYQANNCPICRAPFRALLQIRAVRRIPLAGTSSSPTVSLPTLIEPMDVPSGYEALPLVEALNGPLSSGIWSDRPDIERTPVSVRRSYRRGNDRIRHHHNHYGQRSGGHSVTPALEDIPLPSRRHLSSSSSPCPPITPSSPITRTLPSPSALHKSCPPTLENEASEPPVPEPAPLDHNWTGSAQEQDWSVPFTRIRRKGSDEDPESCSSTSEHDPLVDRNSSIKNRGRSATNSPRIKVKSLHLSHSMTDPLSPETPPTPDVYTSSMQFVGITRQEIPICSDDDIVSTSSASVINACRRSESGEEDVDDATRSVSNYHNQLSEFWQLIIIFFLVEATNSSRNFERSAFWVEDWSAQTYRWKSS